MSWYIKQAIAHRGLHNIENKIPENSYLAFEKAIQNDYAIELDVRLTKDNQVIVFHDSNLKRLTGVNKNVSELKYEEIKSFKLLNTNEKIPLLKDVLYLINGQVPVLIEIKNQEKNGFFENLVSEIITNYKGEVAIHSFNHYSVKWFKDNQENIPRGQIIGSDDKKGFPLFFHKLKYLYLNFLSNPNFIAFDIDILPSFIANYYWDVPTLAWTIDTEYKKNLAESCVDNIIFEKINLRD